MDDLSVEEMRATLTGLFAKKRNYRLEIRQLSERFPYVVFYGCSTILSGIVESWNEQVGRAIDYCCDSDSTKWGKFFCGAKCLSLAELMSIKDQCVVFVTIGDFKPVYNFLKEKGFPSVYQLYKYDLFTSEYLSHCQAEEITERLCDAYQVMADRQSQRVFQAIVTRVLGNGNDIDVMLNVCEKNQYFPPDLITLSDHERLVDVGAFDGDTIRDFVGRTQGKFDKIFSFEVNALNFKALRDNVQQMSERDRIQTHNLGAWDSECDIPYSIGKSRSTIGQGEAFGHVVPLDNVLEKEDVTFIKMDIEGAEPQALRGARNIIKRQKPRLAICIYHDFRHLWEIPLFIKEQVPEYKIYLRHHTNLEYETVCYAR